jgi:hypothetical protein
MGRSNFLGVWDIPNVDVRQSNCITTGRLLSVPYSATPPRDYLWNYRKPFNDFERQSLYKLLSGLWTLPPDWRLDFDFQNHILRQEKPEVELLDHINHIQKQQKKLFDLGGSYTVMDIDSYCSRYCYQMSGSASASIVDEWVLRISPMEIFVDQDWLPVSRIESRDGQCDTGLWKRLV